jgi:hypothetical protein
MKQRQSSTLVTILIVLVGVVLCGEGPSTLGTSAMGVSSGWANRHKLDCRPLTGTSPRVRDTVRWPLWLARVSGPRCPGYTCANASAKLS